MRLLSPHPAVLCFSLASLKIRCLVCTTGLLLRVPTMLSNVSIGFELVAFFSLEKIRHIKHTNRRED